MEPQFIDKRFKAIEQRQDEHEQRVDELQKDGIEKFHELRLYTTKTQGLMEDQIQELRDFRSHVDIQFNRTNERITDVHKDITELELAMRDVKKVQAEHNKKFDHIAEQNAGLDKKLDLVLQLLQKREQWEIGGNDDISRGS